MAKKTTGLNLGSGVRSDIDAPSPLGAIGLVSRTTLGDRVYDRVREAIIRGEIPAGAEINQVELANALGVSRVPVREALRRLQAERLLDANPFQRFVVTELSHEQVLELYDLRETLEVFAALRARQRREFRLVDLPAARIAADDLRLDMSAEEWLMADMTFHRTLYGHGSATTAIIDEVRFRIYRYVHLVSADLQRRAEVLTEHQMILSAMENGSAGEVEGVISAHVGHTRDRLVRMSWAAADSDTPAV